MADCLMGYEAEAKAAFGANINPSGGIVPSTEIADVVLSLFTGQKTLTSGEAILVDKGGAINQITPISVAVSE